MPAAKPRGPARPKCRGCGHAEHAKQCHGRASSSCIPFGSNDGTGTVGYICGYRAPCPCSYRVCKCGIPVALAAELPAAVWSLPVGEQMVASVVRGTANAPGGLLAVRQLADGYLAYRDLAPDELLGPGEWRGTEHTNASCELLAKAEADPKWIGLSA